MHFNPSGSNAAGRWQSVLLTRGLLLKAAVAVDMDEFRNLMQLCGRWRASVTCCFVMEQLSVLWVKGCRVLLLFKSWFLLILPAELYEKVIERVCVVQGPRGLLSGFTLCFFPQNANNILRNYASVAMPIFALKAKALFLGHFKIIFRDILSLIYLHLVI